MPTEVRFPNGMPTLRVSLIAMVVILSLIDHGAFASKVKLENDPNARRLLGTWYEYDEKGKRDDETHIVCQLKGEYVICNKIYDVDRPEIQIQKGDTWFYAQFTMDGRKLYAVCRSHGSKCHYMHGYNRDGYAMVNEDFDVITVTVEISSFHGKDMGPFDPKTYYLRRN